MPVNSLRRLQDELPGGMEVAQKLRILDQYGNYKYDGGFSYSMIHPCVEIQM